MSKNVLIVVDVQNDFVDKDVLGSDMAKAIIPNIKDKIKEYHERGDIIIFTMDSHYENYLKTQEGIKLPVEHCIMGTDGWEIYDNLDDMVDDYDNKKYVLKSSFGHNDWIGEFNEIAYEDCGEVKFVRDNNIELIGLCTDICVVSNALILKSLYPENNISVDAKCCAGVTKESHDAALLTMKMCQINILNEV